MIAISESKVNKGICNMDQKRLMETKGCPRDQMQPATQLSSCISNILLFLNRSADEPAALTVLP